MKRNKFGYLSLLGFLGLLGFLMGDIGFFGFFGFFGFLSVLNRTGSDERIERNFNRAARNGYVAALSTMSVSFVYLITFDALRGPVLFSILFIVSVLSLVVSFFYYDRRGD